MQRLYMADGNNISFNFSKDIIIWRYPADSFSATATIEVYADQKAVITQNGNICDVLDMGVYIASADSLPGLYNKCKLHAGYTGMIEADIWMVSTKPMASQKWQVTDRDEITIVWSMSSTTKDYEFDLRQIIMSGQITLSIKNAGNFIFRAEPSRDTYTSKDVFNLIKKDFFASLPKIIGAKEDRDHNSIDRLEPPYDDLAGFSMHYYNEQITPVSGYRINLLTIESFELGKPQSTSSIPATDIPKKRSIGGINWVLAIVLFAICAGLIYYFTTVRLD